MPAWDSSDRDSAVFRIEIISRDAAFLTGYPGVVNIRHLSPAYCLTSVCIPESLQTLDYYPALSLLLVLDVEVSAGGTD